MDNDKNYSKVKNVDAMVPTQDFQRSIGIGRADTKIAALTHDVNLSAQINERQAAARRGPILEGVVPSVRAVHARKDAGGVLRPWAQPNELEPKS